MNICSKRSSKSRDSKPIQAHHVLTSMQQATVELAVGTKAADGSRADNGKDGQFLPRLGGVCVFLSFWSV